MGPVSSFPLPYSSVWSFVFLVCHEERSSDTQCWLITPTVMTISVNGFWSLEGKKSRIISERLESQRSILVKTVD